jgi:ketosteroid isomerase-like protein
MPNSGKQNNVETARGTYEPFAEGDIDAVTATWDAIIELREPEGIVGGGTLRGHDEILGKLFAGLADEWSDLSVIPQRLVDGGDTVAARTTWSGTYNETGESVEFRGVHVFDFDDGKLVRWTSYADTAPFNAAREN